MCPGWQCGQREERSMKVVGGALSAVELHPWMAAVFSRRSRGRAFTCGGSLISPCWVLTAAHCFPDGSVHKLTEQTRAKYEHVNAFVFHKETLRFCKFKQNESKIYEKYACIRLKNDVIVTPLTLTPIWVTASNVTSPTRINAFTYAKILFFVHWFYACERKLFFSSDVGKI